MTNGQAILIGTIVAIPLTHFVIKFSIYSKKKRIIKLFNQENQFIQDKIGTYLQNKIKKECIHDIIHEYMSDKQSTKH